ncbi:sce7726 family protein [Mycobacteroides abscessus]|uniref:sce7726 family protein n=1 Tax=Mycobacteroides abscessus TaxID=36809 RepID=UPI0009A63DBF|nr:sce7726 family protein [Mycobacteroides abscessus]SLJ76183.1 Uncharacterised protein [Mycobacteroides abscessus subsp. abscessus]SLJ80592.1 Uncharacterised protein [Mycobacteroides abscessus subsp. abscessus]
MVRELANAFSTRVVRELSRPQPALWARQRVSAVAALADPDMPLGAAFDTAYSQLVAAYRCEYVFKTELIHQSLRAEPTANALVGMPVFTSIADVVVAGQTATAFEIKTDLDSFSRLELQLFSYSRCFENVCVVVSAEKVDRALAAVPEHVGVWAFDSGADLTTARPPTGGYSRLDMTSLFRVLRQGERLAVLRRQIGYTADVPSALLYRRTAELFMDLRVEVAYDEFVVELRGRDARQRAAIRAAGLPNSMAAAAAGLVLSRVAWRRLGDLLHSPARQYLCSSSPAA